MSFFAAATSLATKNVADFEVSDPPNDSISSLAFSSAGEFLAAGSWNNEVRIYEVNLQGRQTQGRAMYQHQGPVLSVCWSKDGSKVLSGGADNAARMHDLTTGQSSQVAQHDAPVKSVCWIEPPGILATGSWDKKLKYWDLRSPTPVASLDLPERCYSMDVMYPLLVVGTAERYVQAYSLTNPTVPFKTEKSPLKMQTRVVTCFPSSDGYALGSVEGRAAMHYVDDSKSQHSYTFRCHRIDKRTSLKNESDVYAVNDIKFHPVEGTFSTAGSDGAINFWDKDARVRNKAFDPSGGTIPAIAFNRDGSMFAYAVSYDWSKGHSGMVPGHPNKIMLHACKEEEIKKRSARK